MRPRTRLDICRAATRARRSGIVNKVWHAPVHWVHPRDPPGKFAKNTPLPSQTARYVLARSA